MLSLLFAAIVALLSPGAAVADPKAHRPLEEIVYGGDEAFPPYEFRDERGRPAGLNVDLIRAVGRARGVRVRVELMPWRQVRAALARGRVDVAAMYRSVHRVREVDFAVAHEIVYHEIFVRSGSPPVRSLADLAGKQLLVETDTYAVDALVERGFGQYLHRAPSEPEALRLLAGGAGDAAIVTETVGRPFLYRSSLKSKIVPTGPPILLSEYAFVSRKGRPDLIELLNEGVFFVKGSGEYQRLYTQWIRPSDESTRLVRIIVWVLGGVTALAALIVVWNYSLRRRVAQQTAALRSELNEKEQAQAALVKSEASLGRAQKMEVIGRLAGGVAHDFNNILTVILGSAALLQEDLGARDESMEDLNCIISAAERAARLTRQLLAFSRSVNLDAGPVNICTIAQDTESMLQRLIGKHIVITTVVPAEPVFVEAEGSQIEQVLLNFCANAREAMPEGGRIRITVDTETITDDNPLALSAGDYALIVFSDTGVGMDASTMAQAFEPFFTTRERGRGTGLGLATVSAIVERLQGKVTVASAPGSGTKFTVILPRSSAPEASAQPAAAERGLDRTARGEHILLVEDDEALRRTTRRALERASFIVIEANDGAHALEIANHNPLISMAITDVVMPRCSGPVLVSGLRARRPELPVLYVSGYVQEGQNIDLNAPHTAFLAKPYSAAGLIAAVTGLLADGGLGGATARESASSAAPLR